MDMHTHLLSDGDDYPDSIAEDELKVMIANGVTTIRLMIGTPEQLILRAKSAKGEIIAPTIYSASPHLTGREQGNNFVVKTEEEAREAVRKSKAAGYDFIKITTFIDANVYEAAVDGSGETKYKSRRTRRFAFCRCRTSVKSETADRTSRRLSGNAFESGRADERFGFRSLYLRSEKLGKFRLFGRKQNSRY